MDPTGPPLPRRQGTGWVLAVFAVGLVALTLWRAIDESGPADADLPNLPVGIRISGTDEQCGSGGCWRELRLVGAHGEETRAVLRMLGGEGETCDRPLLLDPRRRCVGVRAAGDHVRMYVTLGTA